MKYLILIVCLAVSSCCEACEKEITVKLSQSHFTLDIWEHVKDAANAVEFKLPVGCAFYDQVKVGDSLLSNGFRGGSLVIRGSIGSWELDVVGK